MKEAPTIERCVTLQGGRTVTYALTRKPVKNLNLRVRPDGSISVSANRRISAERIDAFLQSKSGFILRALERFEKRTREMPPTARYETGETVSVFGEPYLLRVLQGKKRVTKENGILTLMVPDPADEIARRKALAKWKEVTCRETVAAMCERFYPLYASFGVAKPTVRFRKMTSRWGSCHTTKGILTFNDALINAPIPAVEYVVLHEFNHFLHPDHSPAFYRQLAVFLPDWKARRALLRNTPCRFEPKI